MFSIGFVIKNYFYDKLKEYTKKFLYGYLAEPEGRKGGGVSEVERSEVERSEADRSPLCHKG